MRPAVIGETIFGHTRPGSPTTFERSASVLRGTTRNRLFSLCLLATAAAVTTYYTYVQVTRGLALRCMRHRGVLFPLLWQPKLSQVSHRADEFRSKPERDKNSRRMLDCFKF